MPRQVVDAYAHVPEMACIKSIKAGHRNFTLVVKWDNGSEDRVDMRGTVNRLAYFEPLLDPKVFRTVESAFEGYAIAWPGTDLDYAADSLWALACEQRPMTGKDFQKWQKFLHLNNVQVATLLDVSEKTVQNYRHMRGPLPRKVMWSCQHVVRNPAALDAYFVSVGKPGRPAKTAARGVRRLQHAS